MIIASEESELPYPPQDSTLPLILQQADILIQWRSYAAARSLLDRFLADSSSQPIILRNRAKNMWCYALIRDNDPVDSTPAQQMLQSLEMTGTRDDTLTLGQRALNLGFYYLVEDPDLTSDYFDQALMYVSTYYETDNPSIQKYYRDIGSYYFFDAERTQEALDLFHKEEALHKQWKFSPIDRMLNAYNIGSVYRALEEYDLAETYQHRAIDEIPGSGLDTTNLVVLPYSSLCYLYAHKHDAMHLSVYVDTTLILVNRSFMQDTTNLIDYHCTLAMCYIPGNVNDPQRGIAILDRIPQYTPQLKKYAASYGEMYRAKAYLHLGLSEMAEAQAAMRTSIDFFETAQSHASYYEGGYYDALLGLGMFYLEDGKRVPEAVPYIHRATEESFGMTLEAFAGVVPTRYLKYYDRWYDYLVAFGDELIYASKKNVVSQIIGLSSRIDSAITTTRQKVSDSDVLRNAQLNHDIYTYMIGWCHDLHERFHDDRVLHQAFEHFEKSRAHLLLTQLSIDSLADQFGVPTDVINQGKTLTQEELATYSSLSEEETDALLARKQQYFQFLEEHYPDFYHQSYQPDRTTLSEVLALLNEDEAMISYQLRDSQLYALVMTSDTLKLMKSHLNSICTGSIDALNIFVNTRPSHAWDKTDVQSYTQTAKQVFACVLGNVYPLIRNKKQWWIAADGVLELLPFEILVDESAKSVNAFDALSYLVKEHNIGYILSATTWVRERNQPDLVIADVAAFIHSDGTHTVRSFDLQHDISEYQGMPGTAEAAAAIREVFGKSNVSIHANLNATIPAFLLALNTYDVLHLGLHAYADTTGRQRHGIVFPGDESVLTVSDIIGKEIHASVVFLEGCETGVGKQARGEGTLNFARPFIAAGARHVLASRWKLDDQTAGQMSGYFYQQLKAGNDVAVANCEAKRMFLQNALRLQSHPYYWAAVMSVQ